MQGDFEVYEVKDGWHAYDAATSITTFGRTPKEARESCQESVARRARLSALSVALKSQKPHEG